MSEVSRTAFQVFPFLTGFHSPFPKYHSLVFHLISSQFPSLFGPIFVWILAIFLSLLVQSGDFFETRLFHNQTCSQVKSSCWQPLPAVPTPTHQLPLTCSLAAVSRRVLSHLGAMPKELRQQWLLGLAPKRNRSVTNTHIWNSGFSAAQSLQASALVRSSVRAPIGMLLHTSYSVSWKPKAALS